MAIRQWEQCAPGSHFRATVANGGSNGGLLPQLATSGSKGKLEEGGQNGDVRGRNGVASEQGR